MSTLIQQARVVDCQSNLQADILIKNGRIAEIGCDLAVEADEVIDAKGLTLLPSFVDLHTHLREPGQTHKEDLETGCKAAVHGGYTALHLMPNTTPVISSLPLVEMIEQKGTDLGLCQLVQSASITQNFDGTTLSHLDSLKHHVAWFTDDGNGISSLETMLSAMNYAKANGIGLMLHEEDRVLTPHPLAEELPTWRDCQLATHTGARVHFCHVSTAKALSIITEAKQEGAQVSCEVTPHHLALTLSNGGKVAPPLRQEQDRQALITAIRLGMVDAIATDHAPHTPEEKAAGYNGFTGLDLSFATCYTTLVREHQIPLETLSRLLSWQPAQLLGIEGGLIAVGAPANLVLVDLTKSFVAGEEHLLSKSKNSPLVGATLWGEIRQTFWKGATVYAAGLN